MLLTVCKPKGSQAIKSIKETGDMGSFPLLHLGIGAKLQCVYICAYIYMFVTYMMASFELFFFFFFFALAFSLCCLIMCSSCHMYFIIRQTELQIQVKSTAEVFLQFLWLSDDERSLPWFPPIYLHLSEKNPERPTSLMITGLWRICCYWM